MMHGQKNIKLYIQCLDQYVGTQLEWELSSHSSSVPTGHQELS